MSKSDTTSAQDNELGAGDSPGQSELTEEQQLDQDLAAKQDEIVRAKEKVQAAERVVFTLTAEADAMISRLDELRPREHQSRENQKSILRYIESQKKARLERHARRQAVLEKMSPEDLNAAAPIDQSMTRRARRGSRRPQYPTPKV